MKIVAFDPGTTTGYAILDTGRDLDSGFISDINCFALSYRCYQHLHGVDTVIIERPFLGGKDIKDTQFRMAGACEFLAGLNGCPVIWQQPGTPEFIKKRFDCRGLGTLGSQHEWDALSHLLFYYYHTHDRELISYPVMHMITCLGGHL